MIEYSIHNIRGDMSLLLILDSISLQSIEQIPIAVYQMITTTVLSLDPESILRVSGNFLKGGHRHVPGVRITSKGS